MAKYQVPQSSQEDFADFSRYLQKMAYSPKFSDIARDAAGFHSAKNLASLLTKEAQNIRAPDKNPLDMWSQWTTEANKAFPGGDRISEAVAHHMLAEDPDWQRHIAQYIQSTGGWDSAPGGLASLVAENFDKVDDPALLQTIAELPKRTDDPSAFASTVPQIEAIRANPLISDEVKQKLTPDNMLKHFQELRYDPKTWVTENPNMALYAAQAADPATKERIGRLLQGPSDQIDWSKVADPDLVKGVWENPYTHEDVMASPAIQPSQVHPQTLGNALKHKGLDWFQQKRPDFLPVLQQALYGSRHQFNSVWGEHNRIPDHMVAALSPEQRNQLFDHMLSGGTRGAHLFDQNDRISDEYAKWLTTVPDERADDLNGLVFMANRGFFPDKLANALLARPGYKTVLAAERPEYADRLSDADMVKVATDPAVLNQGLSQQWSDKVRKRQHILPEIHNTILNQPTSENYSSIGALYKYGYEPKNMDELMKLESLSGNRDANIEDRYANKSPEYQSLIRQHILNHGGEFSKGAFFVQNADNLDPEYMSQLFESMPIGQKLDSLSSGRRMSRQPSAADLYRQIDPKDEGYELNMRRLMKHPDAPSVITDRIMNGKATERSALGKWIANDPAHLPRLLTVSQVKQLIDEHKNNERSGLASILKAVKTHSMYGAPLERGPIDNVGSVGVKFVEKLRAARDLLEARGGSAHYKELEKVGLNPKSLGIEHLRDPKTQHIRAAAVQTAIDSAPSTEFVVGHTLWSRSLQNHNPKVFNHVMQINLSPSQREKLEQAGLAETFDQLAKTSFASNHPVTPNTLGWIRYSIDRNNGAFIDEIQSDFGQHTERELHKIKNATDDEIKQMATEQGSPEIEPDAARAMAAQHVDKLKQINDLLWSGRHPSDVLHHAFLQVLRDTGHAGLPVHMWQPHTKAIQSGQQVAPHPITKKELAEAIQYPSEDHHVALKAVAAEARRKGVSSPEAFEQFWASKNPDPATDSITVEPPLPVHMMIGYGEVPKKMGYQPDKYGELNVQKQGKTQGAATQSHKLRKSLYDLSLMELMTLAKSHMEQKQWVPLTDEQKEQEYNWEYIPHVKDNFGDFWPTLDHFKNALDSAEVREITPEEDAKIGYRSHCHSWEDLHSLTSSYRFPRDVNRIRKGLENNEPMPHPIVLRFPQGHLRVMSGNTRMDAARLSGKNPHVLIVDVPKEKK